jgi:mannosyltransferase PIG-V
MDALNGATAGFLRYGIVPFIVSRAALVAAIGLANAFVPINSGACIGCEPTPIDELNDWARWDSRWYVEIAQHGYSYAPNEQSSVAFFPLYSVLMRLLSIPLGGDRTALVVAGMIISNVALLATLAVLVRLAATEMDMPLAERVPIFLLVWPTSIFLSAVYPESLFLLLATVAFLSARTGRWRVAGMAAALATLTRPFGILVAVALLFEVARRPAGGRRTALAWLALAPVAALGWWAYLTWLTGEPFAYLITQTRFRRAPSLPFGAVGELFDPAAYSFPYLVGALFVLAMVLVVIAWRRMRPTLPAYATLVLTFVMATGTLSSSMRYELAIFPVLFSVAVLGRRAGLTYVTIGTALTLVLGAMFSRQFWIG